MRNQSCTDQCNSQGADGNRRVEFSFLVHRQGSVVMNRAVGALAFDKGHAEDTRLDWHKENWNRCKRCQAVGKLEEVICRIIAQYEGLMQAKSTQQQLGNSLHNI